MSLCSAQQSAASTVSLAVTKYLCRLPTSRKADVLLENCVQEQEDFSKKITGHCSRRDVCMRM